VRAAPVLTQGLLLVQTEGDRGALIALDALTGAERWRQSGGSAVAPAVDGGRVFAGTNGAFNAFDLATGTLLWDFPTRTDRWTSAVVAGGAVFVCDLTNQTLYALDAATGRQLWNQLGVNGPPAAVGNTVYAASADALFAVDVITGSTRWLEYMDAVGYPVVAEDGVYVVAKRLGTPVGYDLIALDHRGVERWRANLGALLPSSPVLPLDEPVVYVAAATDDGTTDDGAMRLLTVDAADGSVRASVETRAGALSELAVVGGLVCYATGEERVAIVEPATGRAVWSFAGVSGTLTPPVVAGGLVFVGSATPEGGLVVAIGAGPAPAATPSASPATAARAASRQRA
jgi:outer membrane protein assembly factor BamB